MAETPINLTKLDINVMGYTEYDNIDTPSNQKLYIVKDNNADTDNSISSRTYADVGRYAVAYGPTAPTNPLTKIWVDTSDDPVLIQPASIDMDNITGTGATNIQDMIAPDFSSPITYSQDVGETFTTQSAGWLYVVLGAGSAIELKVNNSSGVDVIGSVSGSVSTYDVKMIHHVYLGKNTTLYVNRREGTVIMTFFPCKGIV